MLPSCLAPAALLGLLSPGRRAARVAVVVPESMRGAWLRYAVQVVPDPSPDPDDPEGTTPTPEPIAGPVRA
jgi:hypothetical protein